MTVGRAVVLLAVLGLAGCGPVIGLYHSAEGGAIAQARQAPPGADAPYPNLASVPVAPVALSPAAQAAAVARTAGGGGGGVSAPSPAALAGLALPGAPPPEPNVPDLTIPNGPVAAAFVPVAAVAVAVAKPVAPASAPVALAFAPGSAVLAPEAAVALQGIAAAAGASHVLVGGFGERTDQAGLTLGLARAVRLANALTADGVPAKAIRLVALAGGSGGFVQLYN